MTSTDWSTRILPPLLLLCLLPACLAAVPDKLVGKSARARSADDNVAEETAQVEEIYPNFALPKDIFNEGKPFYVAKDPVTGKFDFNTKKTVGIQNDIVESNDVVDRKDQDVRTPNDINQIQPNFHDFLNLPVKYSSSKSVYPLISSSYSNLKYQGNNKHFVSNHKNYTVDTTTTAAASTSTSTMPPNYFNNERKTSPQMSLDASTHFYPSSATIRITTTTTPKPRSTITFRPRFTTSLASSTPSVYSTITPSSTSTTTPEPPPSSTLRIVPKTTRFAFDRMTTRNKYMDIAATRKKFSPAPTTEQPQVVSKNVTFPTDADNKNSGFVKFEEEKEQRYTETPALPTRVTRRPPLHYSPPMFQTSAKPSGFKPWKKDAAAAAAENNKANKTTSNPNVKISEILDSLFQESTIKKSNRTSARPITQQQLLNQQPPKSPEYDGKIQKQEIVRVNPSFFENNQPSSAQTLIQSQPPSAPFPTKSDLESMMSLLAKNEGSSAGSEDQYVSFKVDQPNMNMVKFSSVPNMNNVVIAPNTDSASFVLGSQQSVGSGTYMSSGEGFSKPQYQVGQVINEYPPNAPPEFLAATLNVQPNSGVSNFRFPNPNEIDQDAGGDQVYTGSYNSKVVVPSNSVSGASQNKVVVFPPGEKMSIDLDLSSNLKTVGSSLSFAPESAPSFTASNFGGASQTGSNVVVAPSEESQDQRPPSFQQLPQNLRPPPFRRVNGGSQSSTRPTQPQQLSPAYVYSELKRRQPVGAQQPQQKPLLMGDPSLPNILPQFRPNAKIGTGHPSAGPYTPYRQPGYDKRPLTRNDMSNARPPPPPSFTVRRTPLPTRYLSRINKGGNSMSPSRAPYSQQQENVEPNRRFFNKMSPNPMQDRMYMQARPAQAPIHVADQAGFVDDYTDGYVGPVPMAESKSDKVSLAMEEQEYGLNPPQRPQTTAERKATFNVDAPKLEPVVTLQMLQFQKGLIKKPPTSFNSYSSAPASSPQYDPIRPQAAALQATAESQNPVYVVYPMKGTSTKMDLMAGHESQEAIVVGHRGSQQPTPPVKTPQPGAPPVYQNTPFSVITHAYQEPILKDKASRPKPNSFPYPLEKPEKPDDDYVPQPNHNEHYHETYDQQLKSHHDSLQDELNQIYESSPPKSKLDKGTPVVISSTLKRVSDSTPIAIAYTPTEPSYVNQRQDFYNPYRRESVDRFSMPNYGQAVISEIRDDAPELSLVQDENIDLGKPPRGATLEQNFQAPFYASVSVSNNDMVTNPYEGWAVVTTPSSKGNDLYSKNAISRSDVPSESTASVASASTAAMAEPLMSAKSENSNKTFDQSSFQPEFLSGFQPIYPSQTPEPRNKATQIQTEAGVDQAPKVTTKSDVTSLKTDKTKMTTTTTVTKANKSSPTTVAAVKVTTTTTSVAAAASAAATKTPTTTRKPPAPKVVAVEKKEDTKKKETGLSFDSLEAFFEELTRDYVDEESTTTSRTD